MAAAIGNDQVGMQRADCFQRRLSAGAHRLPGLQARAYVRQNTRRVVVIGHANRADVDRRQRVDEGELKHDDALRRFIKRKATVLIR